MRIDNSAWGSREFVEKLASEKEMSLEDLARLLKERIDALQKSDESVKYLYLALQEKINEQSKAITTLSAIMKAQHDTLKSIISNLRA